jgi:hypothetical protein
LARIEGGIMRNILLSTFIILLQLNTAIIAKENEDSEKIPALDKEKAVELLDAMGITPYPEVDELESIPFAPELLEVVPLSSADINDDFSNIEDLHWLEDIAKTKKVILFGESHYYQTINYLRNRILFALNTYDYYPLIVIEQQYSLSGFLDHYVTLNDDEKAREYLTESLYELVGMNEDREFLGHIRQWNKRHPEKLIHIAGSDIEHDSKSTISLLLNPYFQSIDSSYYIDPDTVYNSLNLDRIVGSCRKWLEKAKSEKRIGQYPFITPEYVECVIDNLESTALSYKYELNYYRQKAIIRNLTDPQFLGNYLANSKAMVYGGGYHTPTRFPYPGGGNFYREGSYLTFEFAPTRGKTYSIDVSGYAYSLAEMAAVDLDSCLHCGSYYRYFVEKLQKAHKQGLIVPEKYYFVNRKPNEFDRLILFHAYHNNHEPLMVYEFNWEDILEKSSAISEELTKHLRYMKAEFDKHDLIILVPRSVITRLMEKIP